MCAFFLGAAPESRPTMEFLVPSSKLFADPSDSLGARRAFVFTAIVLLALKIALAALLPMTGDEAYFVTWAANPDWGFYDHPPMVGWWLWLLSKLSLHPLVLRLPALLVPIAVALMVAFGLARHGRALAWNAATLVLLTPLNAWNVAITTDVPLMLFCAGALVAYLRALRDDRPRDWLLVGAMLSGALLSKYFAVLLALGLALHVATIGSRGLGRRVAWVAIACAPGLAIHLAWNWQNCWPNLMFNLVNRHGGAEWSWRTSSLYVVTVVYVVTPGVAWALARARPVGAPRRPDSGMTPARQFDASPERAALAWTVGVPLLLLGLLSTFRIIGLHWLAAFVAPAVMWFALSTSGSEVAAALRAAVAIAAFHWIAIAALAAAPIAWFAPLGMQDDLVMALRPAALNARIAPYLDTHVIAAPGYSPAATIGFNLGRRVPVFGSGSAHARQDDMLTDFRPLDGRDILVISKEDPDPEDYLPFFERVEFRREEVLGATFHFIVGHGFRYAQYRDSVLEEIRLRWYGVPSWLPRGACYFCDRYFPDRACHR